MNHSHQPSTTGATVQPGEMELIRNWCAEIVTGAAASSPADSPRHPVDPPFSYRCGEHSSRDWLRLEDAQRRSTQWKSGTRQHTLTWRNAVSGTRCELELTEFAEFPALEWLIRIHNDRSDQ